MTGKRGPKSKTKKELNAAGSNRKHTGEEVELERPQSGRGTDTPPSWLNEAEREIWAELLPKAKEMKTYGNADHTSFGLFCRSLRKLLDTQAQAEEAGDSVEVEYQVGTGDDKKFVKVKKENPLVKTEKSRLDTYNKFADQFGFNPMARTKLQIVPYRAVAPATSPTPGDAASSGPVVNQSRFEKMMGIEPTT